MKRILSFLAAILLPVCALAQVGGDITSGPPSLASLGGITQTQGDARYVLQTTQVIAGTGLTGGGALSANRTLTITNPSPSTSVSGDILTFSNATGALQDSGTLLSSLLSSSTAASTYCALAGCTMAGDLKFTDATYDIGKSGATRPRNIFASGTGIFGGQLAFPYANTTTSGANKTVVSLTSNGSQYGTIQSENTAGAGAWSLGYQSSPGSTIGTAALTWTGAGAVSIPNGLLTLGAQLNVTAMTQTSAAQSGTVCYNSGTGAVTYDATLGCLASSERFKTDIVDIHRPDALKLTMALVPVSFRKRGEFGGEVDPSYHVGFIAEQVAEVDERLVSRNEDGVRGVRYQEMSAIFAGAIQELNRKVIMLEAR